MKNIKNKEYVVALVGNPNSGKTTIFNNLTGQNQKVANWSGVTVERKDGYLQRNGKSFRITDLPGLYSLQPSSPDEEIASRFIKGKLDSNDTPNVIVQIIDGGSLQRSFLLTMQLLELEIPLVLVINMWDEVKRRGIKINPSRLSRLLGIPVITSIGNKGVGLGDLIDALEETSKSEHVIPRNVRYDDTFEKTIADVKSILNETGNSVSKSDVIDILIDSDNNLKIPEHLFDRISELKNSHIPIKGRDWKESITHLRYATISRVLAGIAEVSTADATDSLTDRIDRILLHRYLGIPLFILIMAVLFHITFVIGAIPMEWIEDGVAILAQTVRGLMPAMFITSLLVDGIITGAGTVLVFLPNIILLLMGIYLLEASGYMARVAFLMDRVMRLMGLHGRSFIPMLMGFGCNVPAIMASRTLDNRRDRILTMLLVPLMSCSARLPVYVMVAAAFFSQWGGLVIFSLYMLGTLTALFVGRLFGRTILKGGTAPFIMELPPYRFPTLKTTYLLLRYTIIIYIKRIATVVLVFAIFIWFLSTYPQPSSTPVPVNASADHMNQNTGEVKQTSTVKPFGESTALYKIGKAIDPIFRPLDFSLEMNIALISGFVAKEVVVATFGILLVGDEDADDLSITEQLRENIPSNASALAFLVFVLLYTPCLTAIVTLHKESRSKYWTMVSVVYQTTVAYIGAWITYVIANLII